MFEVEWILANQASHEEHGSYRAQGVHTTRAGGVPECASKTTWGIAPRCRWRAGFEGSAAGCSSTRVSANLGESRVGRHI